MSNSDLLSYVCWWGPLLCPTFSWLNIVINPFIPVFGIAIDCNLPSFQLESLECQIPKNIKLLSKTQLKSLDSLLTLYLKIMIQHSSEPQCAQNSPA